ncbi:MAG: V-type ATP synthase subunit C [Ruminococcaceae bacterium]|nr:V-type ATP synthase subunit C [Oscillospiraceae bacterium]
MPEQYTYAVARIHAKESTMLSGQDMERLLAAAGFNETVGILAEKDYDTVDVKTSDEILSRERERTYKLVSELVSDMSAFDIFFLENDFQNLKAAVKSAVTGETSGNVYVSGGTVSAKLIDSAVKNREFDELPQFLRNIAEKALKALLETNDGGLCDVIIDKAYLEELLKKGEDSDSEMVRRYAELYVAMSDIRIAARGSRLEKSREFFKRSLAECKTLSADSLANAAAKGTDELIEYLLTTDYSDAVEVLRESYVAFEKWCDDRVMDELRKEKFNNFTIGPIAAYILAKEAELKAVGLILTAKQNNLEMSVIRERLRELYV